MGASVDPVCAAQLHAKWKCLIGEYAFATLQRPLVLHVYLSDRYSLAKMGLSGEIHDRRSMIRSDVRQLAWARDWKDPYDEDDYLELEAATRGE